jgi:hypothetical protein
MTKQEQFATELQALLLKYNAEISVEESTFGGYERYASAILIEFDGEVQDKGTDAERYVMFDDLRYGTRILPGSWP